jgi:hypothetical protein
MLHFQEEIVTPRGEIREIGKKPGSDHVGERGRWRSARMLELAAF